MRLAGFDLPEEEISQIKTIVEHHLKKLRGLDFEFLELTLKKSQKGKVFNHEIRGRLKAEGKMLSADFSDYNVFKAVSSVLEKIVHETEHLRRTSRQAV